MGESSKRREEAASRSPNRATLTLRQIHPIAFGGGNMRLSRTAVLRKLQLLRNCKTILATYLKRPLHLRSLPLASGKHPCSFSRSLRANRHCSQRSGNRLTTSKQTAATKHSIGRQKLSPPTQTSNVSGPLVRKPGAKTKAPSLRRKDLQPAERAFIRHPGLRPNHAQPTLLRPGHPPRNQTQQKPNNQENQMRQAHRHV